MQASDSFTTTTRFVYHSIYGKQVIVGARAVDLQKNAKLLIAKDPKTGLPTHITPQNEATLIPYERYINDELDWAELEFGLGALKDYEIVRGPGESNPSIVKVGSLAYKRTY